MEGALGKLPPREDPRTLRLATYLEPRNFPAPPSARDWVDHTHAFDVLGNTTIGDCAFAAQAHLIQCEAAANGKTVLIGRADVFAAYSRVTGYDPAIPGSDRGTNMLDALNDWRANGLAGHKIGAYVKLDRLNRLEIEAAINLFGGIYVGMALPEAARAQTVWDVAGPDGYDETYYPGSWGLHAAACPGYSRTGLTFVTWGRLKIATWEWLFAYADEIYAPLSEDWVADGTEAPNGFDLAALKGDLAAIAQARA